MAEHDYPVQDGADSDPAGRTEAVRSEVGRTEVERRRGPDGLALVVGLLTIGMAVAAFTGHLPLLPHFDPRWLLAAAAALVGVLLLAGSLRRR